MPRFILIALLILCTGIRVLSADISVNIKPEQLRMSISTTKLEGRNYVDLDDLCCLLSAMIKQDLSDHRVYFHIYGEQFIFLTDSAFYSFKTDIFNMHYPLMQRADHFFVPEAFLLELLPLHFPDKMELKANVLNIVRPADNRVAKIVLDPGHGGKDPGAVGKNGTWEKTINLNVALKLKAMLEKELGVKVLLTRPTDKYVSLGDRTRFANDNKADLFVSLHTNSSKSRSARGLETYYLSTSRNTDNRAVEALENDVVELYEGKAEQQKYDDLAFILSDLVQTENLENSNHLATLVQRNIVAGIKTSDRGVKQAGFYVLRGAFMPSILVEMGFISNPDEEALLANPTYQERLARSIFEGIKRFKFRYDRTHCT